MGLRLGATTKPWPLGEYMEDENLWEPGHSTAAPGSEIKKKGGRSRRHARYREHGHLMTPLKSETMEGPRTGHGREEKDPSSLHQQATPAEADRGKGLMGSILAWTPSYDLRKVVTSAVCVILPYIIIIACLRFFFGNKASGLNAQPRSSLRSVLQSQDLIIAKSHSDSVYFTLNSLPSNLPLDSAGSKISFDESRFSVDDVALKLSQGIQQVDLLGSLIGRQLSPSIKANVHTDNCSLAASIHPIAQTAQVQFNDTLNAFDEIRSSYDNAVTVLTASRFGVQQALDHADTEMRSWNIKMLKWNFEEDGEKKRRDFTEMETSRRILKDAIESLSSVRETVNLKVGRYRRSSAELDILVENLHMMTRTEGKAPSRCGIAEAEVVERQLKVMVSQASSDVQGTQSFEEYYEAI